MFLKRSVETGTQKFREYRKLRDQLGCETAQGTVPGNLEGDNGEKRVSILVTEMKGRCLRDEKRRGRQARDGSRKSPKTLLKKSGSGITLLTEIRVWKERVYGERMSSPWNLQRDLSSGQVTM